MKGFSKIGMSVLAISGVCAALAGCGNPQTPNVSVKQTGGSSPTAQEVTMPASENGKYMDWMETVYSQQFGEALCEEPLMILNSNGSVTGSAVKSWSVSKDKLTWTFHLRHLTWSDGSPLTANDYVFGFQHAASPSTAYDFGWFWETVMNIKNWGAVSKGTLSTSKLGVSAPDPYTLKITTAKPVPFLPMGLADAFPEPPALVKKYGLAWASNPKTMLFSGPYQIQSWTPNQSIVFVPNNNYKGTQPHNLKKITLALVAETDYSGFQTNQVAWTMLDQGQFKAAQASTPPDSRLVTIHNFLINMLAFNEKVKPLNNPDVRKAISLAIDKNTLVNSILKGSAAPDTSVVPKGFPGYDPAIKEPFNVKEAQQLLAKAGYPGGKGFPTLTLEIRNEPNTIVTTQPGAEFIQSQLLQNLGINVNVKVYDLATWIDHVNSGKAQMFIRPYQFDYLDPSNWYSLFLPGGIMTWNNPQFVKLVNQANGSFNPTQRTQLYNQAADLMNKDTAAVFLWSDVQGYLVKNYLQNFPTTPVISVSGAWVNNLKVKN